MSLFKIIFLSLTVTVLAGNLNLNRTEESANNGNVTKIESSKLKSGLLKETAKLKSPIQVVNSYDLYNTNRNEEYDENEYYQDCISTKCPKQNGYLDRVILESTRFDDSYYARSMLDNFELCWYKCIGDYRCKAISFRYYNEEKGVCYFYSKEKPNTIEKGKEYFDSIVRNPKNKPEITIKRTTPTTTTKGQLSKKAFSHESLADIKFIGCFEDREKRDMEILLNFDYQQTIQRCAERCTNEGYLYAGLQNSVECFCSNDYGKYGRKPDSECNHLCPGNLTQNCGGNWRNSVYRLIILIKDYLRKPFEVFESTRFTGHYNYMEKPYLTINNCWASCLDDNKCKAASFVNGTKDKWSNTKFCFYFSSEKPNKAEDDKEYFTSMIRKI